ncbi:MAG: carboxymuconolactone decarboxylase family protein [Microbacterium enclense]
MRRIDLSRTNRTGYAAVLGLEAYSRTHVDRTLYELIKLRASIVNGCGFCVDMHATDAARRGVPHRTLHAVSAWQHAGDLLDDRQRAALALTDAITRVGPESVTDAVWERAASFFSEKELGSIVLAIATINVWNRIALATGMTPPVDDAHPAA